MAREDEQQQQQSPDRIMGQVQGGHLFPEELDPDESGGEGSGYEDQWQGGQRREPDANEGQQQQQQQSPEVAALQEQVKNLSSQLERMQTDAMMLMQQPPGQQQQQQPQQQQQQSAEPEDMPDPYDEPEAYAAAVEKRIRAKLDAERQQEQQQAQQQEQVQKQYSALWNDFQSTYPALAGDLSRVRFAANEVAQEAAARGVDLNRYMFHYKAKFMEDVAAKMKDVFGIEPGGKQQQQQQSFQNPQQQPPADPNADQGRTDGVFGAMPGPRPQQKQAPENDDPFADIREFQLKNGFYS